MNFILARFSSTFRARIAPSLFFSFSTAVSMNLLPESLASFSVACILIIVCSLSSLVQVQARQFPVGGRDGWVVHPAEDHNQWAGRHRFLINDTLLFKYKKGGDSVLLVSKDGYDKCDTHNPIKKWDDGDTVFQFDRSPSSELFADSVDGSRGCGSGFETARVECSGDISGIVNFASYNSNTWAGDGTVVSVAVSDRRSRFGTARVECSGDISGIFNIASYNSNTCAGNGTVVSVAVSDRRSRFGTARVECSGDISGIFNIASYNSNTCAGNGTVVSVAVSDRRSRFGTARVECSSDISGLFDIASYNSITCAGNGTVVSVAVSDRRSRFGTARVEYSGDISVPVHIASYNSSTCAGHGTVVYVAVICSNGNSSSIRSNRARGAGSAAAGAVHHFANSRRVSSAVSTTRDANRCPSERDLAFAEPVSCTCGESSQHVGIGILDDGSRANLTETKGRSTVQYLDINIYLQTLKRKKPGTEFDRVYVGFCFEQMLDSFVRGYLY
ncbi:hypothetical protein NL676_024114 [Syzygium grande]|nr:hypothetical protein NL676_024114 [Syzygium grande]